LQSKPTFILTDIDIVFAKGYLKDYVNTVFNFSPTKKFTNSDILIMSLTLFKVWCLNKLG